MNTPHSHSIPSFSPEASLSDSLKDLGQFPSLIPTHLYTFHSLSGFHYLGAPLLGDQYLQFNNILWPRSLDCSAVLAFHATSKDKKDKLPKGSIERYPISQLYGHWHGVVSSKLEFVFDPRPRTESL